MFDFLFGFDRRMDQSIRWSFNLNHLLLVLVIVSMTIILYKLLPTKSQKSIIITKISLISIMFLLEIGRILWTILRHYNENGSLKGLNWARTISFTICAINVWLTIGFIITTTLIKTDNKAMVIFKNILYGSAAFGGILMFVYPENLDHYGAWHILHFRNLQTVLQHFFLFMVPFYLIKTGEIKNLRLKNIWMPLLGLFGGYTLIVTASQVTGHNFQFALGNFDLPYPGHKFIILFLALIFIFILYLPHEIKHRFTTKKVITNENPIRKISFNKYTVIDISVVLFTIISTVFGPLLFGASYGSAIESMIALIFLIPLVIMITTLITTSYLRSNQLKF